MKLLQCLQGSPEWHAERAKHYCASDAAAAMGVSKYSSRDELIRQYAIGTTREVTPVLQRLFNDGHQSERAARPIVERTFGEDLFPVVGTEIVEGLPLLASMDGLTLMADRSWENKLFNADLAAQVRRGELDAHYWSQLEHQALVSGVRRIYFTTSDGTEANTVGMWYESREDRRAQVLAAWKQFQKDVADYKPAEIVLEAVGSVMRELPALVVTVEGRVLSSNLDVFRQAARDLIGGIRSDLQNDQDFADAEKAVKWCKDGEDRLDLVKQQALSQTSTIDELFRTIDEIREALRDKRLSLDKLIKGRKEQIRFEVVEAARRALAEHVAGLNKRLAGAVATWLPGGAAPVTLPAPAYDFGAAIKGKKTIDSLRNATNTLLAQAKIETNQQADGMEAKLRSLMDRAPDHAFLFMDASQLVLKADEDLALVVESRLSAESTRKAVEQTAAVAARTVIESAAAGAGQQLTLAPVMLAELMMVQVTIGAPGVYELAIHPDSRKVVDIRKIS